MMHGSQTEPAISSMTNERNHRNLSHGGSRTSINSQRSGNKKVNSHVSFDESTAAPSKKTGAPAAGGKKSVDDNFSSSVLQTVFALVSFAFFGFNYFSLNH